MFSPRIFRLFATATALAVAPLCTHAQSDSQTSSAASGANTPHALTATNAAPALAGTQSIHAANAPQEQNGVAAIDSGAIDTQTPLQLFALAGSAYETGRYAEAAQLFNRLAALQPNTINYYNLGNAYFRNGQYGQAIAAYEKAHALDHTQPEVLANLNRAKEVARISAPPVGRWEDFARKLSPNTWTLLLALSFWATLALWLIPAQYKKPHGIWRPSLLALAIAIFALCALGLYPWRELARAGTVLEADTPLLLAPVSTSPVQSYAQAGQPAQWVRSHGGFDRIRLPDGAEGWVAAPQFSTTWAIQR